jgi:hypothetical protein
VSDALETETEPYGGSTEGAKWPNARVGAIMCFAGPAAEARYLNCSFDEMLMSSGIADLALLYCDIIGTRDELWQADREKDACSFVERNWSLIEKVAGALFARRELDYAAVIELTRRGVTASQ